MKGKASKKGQDEVVKETKPKINYEEIIKEHLTNPGFTFDKTAFAFLTLNMKAKGIDSLHTTYTNFKHITYIDMSENFLQDFSVLGQLPNLIDLNLRKNNIKDLKSMLVEDGWKNLQNLDLSENKIVDLTALKAPKLLKINLNDNKIEKAEGFEGHPTLIYLYLRKNKLNTTAVLKDMPNLKELYLVENRIKVFTGLENCGSLKVLHLRKNFIENFEEALPNLESLEYLNLRENKISKMEDIQKLTNFPNLKTLIFSYNPITTLLETTYFFETLIVYPRLIRINKFHITKSIRKKCYDYSEEKWNVEQEAKRKADQEAEEKARLEEEKNNEGKEDS